MLKVKAPSVPVRIVVGTLPPRVMVTPLNPVPLTVTFPETFVGGNSVLLAVEIAEVFGVIVALPEDMLPVTMVCPLTAIEKLPDAFGGVITR